MMYSTFQRLNHLVSISTTFVMILLGLVSLASFFTAPEVGVGKVDVHDLIVKRGRIQRWGSKEEDVANLRFDLTTDLNPLLNSYNTKQVFIYLVAAYDDKTTGVHSEVTLWDTIITRGDTRDFRAVHAPRRKGGPRIRKGRGNMRIEDVKNAYLLRNPSRSFKNIQHANVTLHYSVMPYVGMVTTGVAATAQGMVEIPPVKR